MTGALAERSTSVAGTRDDVTYLRSPRAIRERSRALFDRALAGDSDAFVVRLDALERVADYVAGVARRERLALAACHGRMRHFDAGGRDRVAAVEARLASASHEERARAKIDLLVPSVLLDAGAGEAWRYVDDGVCLARSEGLAVASLRWITSGGLSSEGASSRVDAKGLAAVSVEGLARAFQVRDDNPLVGLEGRAALLVRLGRALAARADLFGAEGRPGQLFDALARRAEAGRVRAAVVLELVLDGLSSIWPGRASIGAESLGDAWAHPALGAPGEATSIVPFHKLSQWLVHSLAEPLREGGIEVTHREELTPLAEYRTGGLLFDLGAITLRRPERAAHLHHAGDALVVEWRALTVSLLDVLAPRIVERLGLAPDAIAGGILSAATWMAGRAIAAERRPRATSPIAVDSDGTVF